MFAKHFKLAQKSPEAALEPLQSVARSRFSLNVTVTLFVQSPLAVTNDLFIAFVIDFECFS